MRLLLLRGLAVAILVVPVGAQTQRADPKRDSIIARAKALELPTKYVLPPGDSLVHYASGYAKVMCSAVFISGLDPTFAAQNVGYFTAPYSVRATFGTPVVDRAKRAVHVSVPNGPERTALYLGDQGCVTLPIGKRTVDFTPVTLDRHRAGAATTPWPMGDALPTEPLPAGVDTAGVRRAIDAAFAPSSAMTAAVVVTWKGRIVGERYAPGITATTPLESWSMGKSLTATLLGVLIQQGVYTLDQPAPIPEWRERPDDPRAKIRIEDILHMSSGLRIRAPLDPDYDASLGYADHFYLYTGSVNSFHYAATRPPQWPPNTVGRYRNTDPVLANYLIRLALEKRREPYLSFPQRALFDKLGMRTMVIETDPEGDFLTQGYDHGAARDWARLGNLYLQDGVWRGERLLPEGYAHFVSTVAPAWKADNQPIYGGFFWINGDGGMPIPKDAYYMNGAGDQYTVIVPSHQLVVVRLGHFRGEQIGGESLNRALALLMTAVPESPR